MGLTFSLCLKFNLYYVLYLIIPLKTTSLDSKDIVNMQPFDFGIIIK